MPPPPCQRRARIPFLHAESRRPDRRDLPPARRARAPPSRSSRHRLSRMTHLLDYLQDRVLLCDGAMGTQAQSRNFHIEKDFHGHENCTEILTESRPDFVREV